MIKGDAILKADVKLLSYLLQKGCNPNVLYEEDIYSEGPGYMCTPVIQAIRHDSTDRSNIKLILKELLLKGADISIQDTKGRDALMHVVIRNHANTFAFILDSL